MGEGTHTETKVTMVFPCGQQFTYKTETPVGLHVYRDMVQTCPVHKEEQITVRVSDR